MRYAKFTGEKMQYLTAAERRRIDALVARKAPLDAEITLILRRADGRMRRAKLKEKAE